MKLLSRHAHATGVRGSTEPRSHVMVTREVTPACDTGTDTPPSQWDEMHMVLAVWKARSLLAEALSHLSGALPSSSGLDPAFEREFRSAVDATVTTIERLRTVTAAAAPINRNTPPTA